MTQDREANRLVVQVVGVIVALGDEINPRDAVGLARLVTKTSRFVQSVNEQALGNRPTPKDYSWWLRVECAALVELAGRFGLSSECRSC